MESHQLSSVETTEAFLGANGIKFNTVRHEITPTNAEMVEKVTPLFVDEYKNTKLAKQLFLYDKKKKDNMYLVCA